ncbi:MAG: hypothetical protein ACR652_10205 [Methylocystis sp.]|uniref:hypothetical protein n=1 Tax=Methylocystis sp. TaxID=1911079 RepID=UPI003DA535F9
MSGLVSAKVVAEKLGCDERTVRNGVKVGWAVRTARGLYDLDATILAYCCHIRSIASGHGGEAAAMDLSAARARLAVLQGDGQELKNAIARGEYLLAADVSRCWDSMCHSFRQRMLTIPTMLATEISTLTQQEIFIIDRAIRDGLTELADMADAEGKDLA